MAIREFAPEGIPRAKIAFIGELPEGDNLNGFKERSFACELSTLASLRDPTYTMQLDAVIWTQRSEKLNALPRELGTTIPRLLDHDVRVYIRLATDPGFTNGPRKLVFNALREAEIPVANLLPEEWVSTPEGRRERPNSFLLPSVYLFEAASSWAAIATLVCDRPAGPAPKSALKVDEAILLERFGSEGHDERLILLKRAFWNCSELKLSVLDGGMSGAPVFKAYASLESGLVQPGIAGAYPHLYFVKIGPRKRIIAEYDKYFGHVFEYIPFHLGPRLRRDRCNLGATQGIVVGDFVEGAESLIACARGDRCGHAISNLFEKTLAGWRKQGRLDSQRSLGGYFENKWLTEEARVPITLPPERDGIVHQLGGDGDVTRLKKMFDALGNRSCLVAPAHGDMHATNILVRHGDAILIDFEKIEEHFPLTYDPASLEGGLLVEGFVKELENGTLTPVALVKAIEPLYRKAALSAGAMTLCHRGDATEWFYNAVNQIRTLNWSAEGAPGQYALTLALCLIRKGCNPHAALKGAGPNASRAVAFFLGQKILREMAESAVKPHIGAKPAPSVNGASFSRKKGASGAAKPVASAKKSSRETKKGASGSKSRAAGSKTRHS